MSSKHYCDICGKETSAGIDHEFDMSVGICHAKLPDVAGIDDCCNNCRDILYRHDTTNAVLLTLKNICIPKTESQVEKDFIYWLAGLSWVEQQRIFNRLKDTFKLNDGGNNNENN